MYQYRWWLAIFLGVSLCLVDYIYQLRPLMIKLQELSAAEIVLREKLTAVKNISKKLSSKHELIQATNNASKNKLNRMDALLVFMQSSGLNVEAINIENDFIHLLLKGDYQQLFFLIDKLSQQHNFVTLKNFSYKALENNLLITLVVSLEGDGLNKNITHKQTTIKNRFNPFCSTYSMDKWLERDDGKEIFQTPLAEIKMIGCLQLGERKQALLLFPNGAMKTVESGFVLGAEKGRVMEVDKDHVVVKLKDQKMFVLA
jgi:hypothetical protein